MKIPRTLGSRSFIVMERTKGLIDVSLTSDKYSVDELKPFANKFESMMVGVKGVSDITIFGDSDLHYEVLLDEKKIEAYGLNSSDVYSAISSLSYIYFQLAR
ncbi:MAG TPA: efflux RND transporter permease subunit [Sulfurovum sp.]|nr:efflux RND transporter permease subunit [Sulfurovum sp.]